MTVAKIVGKWKRFGTLNLVKVGLYRLARKAVFFLYGPVTVYEPADTTRPTAAPPAGLRFIELTPDQCRAYAADPRYQMPPYFVERSLSKGDRCLGWLDGDVLAGYIWYSNGMTTTAETVDIGFGPSYLYIYQAFVLAPYRGLRLHSIGKKLAMEIFAKEGYRAFLGFIELDNLTSIAAMSRSGRETIGWILIVKLFGRAFVLASRSARELGFRARMTDSAFTAGSECEGATAPGEAALAPKLSQP